MRVARCLPIVLVSAPLGLAGASCAHRHEERTMRPEHRDLRCVGGTSCAMDRDRGCRVCQRAPFDRAPAPPDDDARLPE